MGWEDPLEKGKATTTPVFWSGEFHGLYSSWRRKELDTTEQLSLSHVRKKLTFLKPSILAVPFMIL